MREADKTMSEVAKATTGADSADQASIHRPASGAIFALSCALAVACIFGGVIIGVLTWRDWPEMVAKDRIHVLGWMGLLSIGCIHVVVIAFATPWVGRISASAGAASVSVEARD